MRKRGWGERYEARSDGVGVHGRTTEPSARVREGRRLERTDAPADGAKDDSAIRGGLTEAWFREGGGSELGQGEERVGEEFGPSGPAARESAALIASEVQSGPDSPDVVG